MWVLLTINLTLTHTVFCKFERNTCSTQAMVCFRCQIWYYSQLFTRIRWSKQSKGSNTKCFHWLKIIWQRIPNFKNFIIRTSVLSFVAASPLATWRESRTYDWQHNTRAIEFPQSTRFTRLLLLQIQRYMRQGYINTTHSFYLRKCFTHVVEFSIQIQFS